MNPGKRSLFVAGTGFVIVLVVLIWYFSDQGAVAGAFDGASRDSFGTDVSKHVVKALPIGTHFRNIEAVFKESGFMCHRSQFVKARQIWTCQRRAFRLNLSSSAHENWTVEFECDPGLASCTIVNLLAEIN